MTPLERFRFKCQEHWTAPYWDTKKVFTLLMEDGDLTTFVTRELGKRSDYFTEEQEYDLQHFVESYLEYYKIQFHRIDYTILTLKLLLTLYEDIMEYKWYRGLIEEFPTHYPIHDFDHE